MGLSPNFIHGFKHIVGFVSTVLSTCTFFVCVWIAVSADLNLTDTGHHRNNCKEAELVQIPSCNEQLVPTFISALVTISLTASVISILQFLSGVYLLLADVEEFRERGKTWVAVNIGVNVVFIICLMTVSSFPIAGSVPSASAIKYFPAFIIATFTNVCFGLALIVVVMMFLHLVKRVGVALVQDQKWLVQHI